MLLKDLMAILGVPDPNYEGVVVNDDNILAVDISDTQDAQTDDFAVAQNAIESVNARLAAEVSEKQYLRAGRSSTKTGTQRTFQITGDRRIGDPFQDYVFDIARLYGTGEAVIVRYVWFNALKGSGEHGQATVLVKSDGSGAAGETAAIDVELKKYGAKPIVYRYGEDDD